MIEQYKKRIDELRQICKEDEENFSEESFDVAMRLLESMSHKALVGADDNGNAVIQFRSHEDGSLLVIKVEPHGGLAAVTTYRRK